MLNLNFDEYNAEKEIKKILDIINKEYNNLPKLVPIDYYKWILFCISTNYELSMYYKSQENIKSDASIETSEIKNILEIIAYIACNKEKIYINYSQFEKNLIKGIRIYYEKNYIFRKKCMQNIIETKKMSSLLKLNPYAVNKYMKYIQSGKITKEEEYIYEICNPNQEQYQKIARFEIPPEEIQYIISNVYEVLKIKECNLNPIEKKILKIIETEYKNPYRLINLFIANKEIQIRLLEIFIKENSKINEGKLEQRKSYIKQNKLGDISSQIYMAR